jgi:hypothetical protein
MSEELTEAEQKAWDETVSIHGGYDGYEWIFQAGVEYGRTPDTSAVELVEEGLRIVSTPLLNFADRHQFITKAEQWLKNRGA